MDEERFKSWYNEEGPRFERLADVVKNTIETALKSRRIFVSNVESRIKSLESGLEKSQKRKEDGTLKYTDPKTQIMDYAGVRVVTYLMSDMEYIGNIITDHFDSDKENFTNKAEGLGADKVGYLSTHYIVSLKKDAVGKTDYDDLKALKCEIQVRTVLQHAWAQNFHDRQYKLRGAKIEEDARVPEVLARKTNLIAGNLELLDRDIVGLAQEYDRWLEMPDNVSFQKILDKEPDMDSLVLYIQNKLGVTGKIEVVDRDRVNKLLQKFGIENLRQLNALVSNEFVEAIKQENGQRITVDRFIDCLFIWSDPQKYFAASSDEAPKYISAESFRILSNLGVPVDEICSEYSIIRRETR